MSIYGATATSSGLGTSRTPTAFSVAGGRGRTFVIALHGDTPPTSVTDTSGNTGWTKRASFNFTGAKVLEFWSISDPVGGPAYQVTSNYGSSVYSTVDFLELIGTLAAEAFDTFNAGNADNVSPYTSNVIAPTVDNAVVLGLANPGLGGAGTVTFTHGADGFTPVVSWTDSNVGPPLEVSAQLGNTSGSYQLNYTSPTPGAEQFLTLLTTFKLATLDRPQIVLIGAPASGIAGVTPAWPTGHEANDIGLLLIESAGGEPANLTTANGFGAVTNSPSATGAGTAGTRVTAYWCRATGSAQAAPVVTDPGDHVTARILVIRGCVTTGDPWDTTAASQKASASTSASAPAVTTSTANCLVVNIIARDDDAAGAEFSSWANADLTYGQEFVDSGTTSGNGGGLGVYAGNKATAGAVSSTTATVTNSINASLTIAFQPVTTTSVQQSLMLLGVGA